MLDKSKMEQDLKYFLVEDLLVDFTIEEISPNMSLGNELGVDSLGFTELMAHVEDVYNIKISDEEFVPENFRTINAIIELIEKKLNITV
ncbi:acyl carrier protein [Lysinibacillus sp. Bpr_S20]|uniref:acyl carrier protein n=1 Tax=Lysinibacillus sp. Bpr_S20 TaxID=2933964 RepID=UPI0020131A12|nr:acyl carrier protein [Lysinibacillus sp. Bpr_S20]MCL1702974.1 acyl carrier protein [Lysinibacillus sp. Bpr_S20]